MACACLLVVTRVLWRQVSIPRAPEISARLRPMSHNAFAQWQHEAKAQQEHPSKRRACKIQLQAASCSATRLTSQLVLPDILSSRARD